MELFKDLEGKADQIRNPGGWLKNAAVRAGLTPPPVVEPLHGQNRSTSGGPSGDIDYEYEKVSKRAFWLSKNVFTQSPIDDHAVAALTGMGVARAMELFKEIEEKGDQIRNPSAYLKNAAAREGFAPLAAAEKVTASGMGPSADLEKASKRAYWLSKNVFTDRPIDDNAVAAVVTLGIPRAMELFKEMEQKADEIRNPSSYLKTAVSREGLQPQPQPQPQSQAAWSADSDKVSKRAYWLSKNVFIDRPISDEAVAAMAGVGSQRAMELFKDLEQKADKIENPSGWLLMSARREGGQPEPNRGQAAAGREGLAAGAGSDSQKVLKRAQWLNFNVFAANPINDDAIAAISALSVQRAMEIFKDVEQKGDQVRNPSSYLISAAGREAPAPGAPYGAKRQRDWEPIVPPAGRARVLGPPPTPIRTHAAGAGLKRPYSLAKIQV